MMQLGVTEEQAARALRLLSADECSERELSDRVQQLCSLTRACGSLQNAKLAYSLVSRSGERLDRDNARLLGVALQGCHCVPAGVKLWHAAVRAGATQETWLTTASLLGSDGEQQVRILDLLRRHSEWSELVGELARQLNTPGWQADGSWGAVPDPERGLVWWDFAAPRDRKAYGMSLTSDLIDLTKNVGTSLCFDYRMDITGVTDRCHLEVTTDDLKWVKLKRYEGRSDWTTDRIDLREYDGQKIRLRFHVISGGQREGRGFEMSAPRLLTVPVSYRLGVDFPLLADGWRRRTDPSRTPCLSGHVSEQPQASAALSLPSMKAPTLTFEGRLVASSVYASARVEALDQSEQVIGTTELPTGAEWKAYRQPLEEGLPTLKLKLTSRFNARRDEDGLWIRRVQVQGGDAVLERPLDGGGGDGELERLALLELLSEEDLPRLEVLSRLRRGLPSLSSALALLPMVERAEHVPVLLHLFSVLKEEAVSAFSMLSELIEEEDMELQSQVMLTAGLENYSSTRDHLGHGLLTEGEFEDNCRLYLELREQWTEEAARTGLSLLMTPVAEEDGVRRREVFRKVLEDHPQAADFFEAWDTAWDGL